MDTNPNPVGAAAGGATTAEATPAAAPPAGGKLKKPPAGGRAGDGTLLTPGAGGGGSGPGGLDTVLGRFLGSSPPPKMLEIQLISEHAPQPNMYDSDVSAVVAAMLRISDLYGIK